MSSRPCPQQPEHMGFKQLMRSRERASTPKAYSGTQTDGDYTEGKGAFCTQTGMLNISPLPYLESHLVSIHLHLLRLAIVARVQRK